MSARGFTFNGKQYGTGCLKPDKLPTSVTRYSTAFPVYSKSDLESILADPNRVSARKLFDKNQWKMNQARTNACNAFAAIKALRKTRVKRGLEDVRLSPFSLYARINGGRDDGSLLVDAARELLNGVARESLVPGDPILLRDISSAAIADQKNFCAVECYQALEPLEFASGLAAGFVGVVAVHVANPFFQLDANGVAGASRGPGNHAVNADDFRFSNKGALEIDHDGSWDLSYGDNGRAWLNWDRSLAEPAKYHGFYLIRSTNDGNTANQP